MRARESYYKLQLLWLRTWDCTGPGRLCKLQVIALLINVSNLIQPHRYWTILRPNRTWPIVNSDWQTHCGVLTLYILYTDHHLHLPDHIL